MNRTLAICLVACLSGISVGAPVDLIVDDLTPIGAYGTKPGNFLDVSVDETTGITRIEIGVSGGESSYAEGIGGARLAFGGTWPAAGWTRINFLSYDFDFSDGGRITDEFNPYGAVAGAGMSRDLVLPPVTNPRFHQYRLTVGGPSCGFPCHGTYELEFLVESMEAPLVGDFNLDGRVGFADFLVLSENFERPDQHISPPHWNEGDTNLDRRVDSSDFVLFREHFGDRRITANAVPEPRLGLLQFVVAFAVFALRHCTLD